MKKRFSAKDNNIIASTTSTSSSTSSNKFDIFKDKPFWISDIERHKAEDISTKGHCCFNHILGLPKKDGIEKPIFDYETDLVKNLEEHGSVWIKKSRGLGVTEIILRYISWLCTRNNDGKRIHIVTGPRINLAEDLIDRISNLFSESKTNPIQLYHAGPIISLNGCLIQAFPSNTISSSRGYTEVKLILVDEASFFIPSMQEEVRAVVEGYRAKTNPKIVVISTPWKPIGFFYDIDKDPYSAFKKLSFHYTVGLNKIYNPEDIEKEKNQPYFQREFCLKYAYGTGNVFLESSLQKAEELGKQYKDKQPPYNQFTPKALGIDPGFGSSKTAFTIIEYVDNIVRVIYSKQFEHSSTEDMANHAYNLIRKFNLKNDSNRTFIDGSQPGFIRSLKIKLSEYPNYEHFVERSKKDNVPLYLYMNIVPVNFTEEER